MRIRKPGQGKAFGRLTALTLCLGLFAAFLFQFYTFGLEVTVKGQRIGVVSNASVFDAATSELSEYASESLGQSYRAMLTPSFAPVFTKKSALVDTAALRDRLVSLSGDIAYAYVLTVDGLTVGAVTDKRVTEAEIRKKIESIVHSFGESLLETKLPQISFDYRLVEKARICTSQQLLDKLAGLKSAGMTTLGESETVAAVSAHPGLPTERDAGSDPTAEEEGAASAPPLAESVLTVKTISLASESKTIPYETVYQNNPKLSKGTSEVTTEGQNGSLQITYEVLSYNGTEVSKKAVDEKILVEPVAQVVEVGTKQSSALFSLPVKSGHLSSDYGWRMLRGRKNLHTGIDFAVSIGTTVRAAADGVVVKAGVYGNGNYGRLVAIDHGNGFVTYYAHNSKLLVKVGQKVERGDAIAKSGNSGNSTGPHVHFEVRKNGTAVSPWKYLE